MEPISFENLHCISAFQFCCSLNFWPPIVTGLCLNRLSVCSSKNPTASFEAYQVTINGWDVSKNNCKTAKFSVSIAAWCSSSYTKLLIISQYRGGTLSEKLFYKSSIETTEPKESLYLLHSCWHLPGFYFLSHLIFGGWSSSPSCNIFPSWYLFPVQTL